MISFVPLGTVPITPRAEYWTYVWDEKLRFYQHNSRGLHYNVLISVLEIAAIELSGRRFQSFGMRELVRNHLQHTAASHPAIRQTALAGQLRSIANDVRSPSIELQQRVSRLLVEVSGRKFEERLLDCLATCLENTAELSERERLDIEVMTNDVIVRLARRGFGVRRLGFIPTDLLAPHFEMENDLVYVRFPVSRLGIDKTLSRHGHIALADVPDIVDRLASLSQRDRIMGLQAYFDSETREKTYIFGVDGLQGHEAFQVSGVRFYSPVDEPMLDRTNDPSLELIGRTAETHPVNAVVTLNVVDEEYGGLMARESVESALDALRVSAYSLMPLQIRHHRRIIQNPDFGIYAFTESRADSNEYVIGASIDSSSVVRELKSTNSILTALAQPNDPASGKQIRAASHWYRKAYESSRPEDRLLFYWVALEKLFSSDEPLPLIQGGDSPHTAIANMLPTITALIRAQTLPSAAFSYLSSLWTGRIFAGFGPKLAGDGLAEIVGDDVAVNWASFEAWLTKSIDMLPASRAREYLQDLQRCTVDSKEAYKYLSVGAAEADVEIKLIYWLRNRLVHDAEFRDPMMGYYADLAQRACAESLRIVISASASLAPPQALIEEYCKGERFLADLRSGFVSLKSVSDL